MYFGLHVKYKLLSSILMKLEFSRNLFERYIKFNDNPVVTDGQKTRRTDMRKLMDAFRNFMNAPENSVTTNTFTQLLA